jgi:DNA-binding beta-propeller fold protein YncE
MQGRLGPWLAALATIAFAAAAQAGFVNFESGHVRPLALSPDGSRLFAVNTPDGRLEIYGVGAGGLTLQAEVPVGLEPVAVAARSNTEVWVVNHLSDSVSIVAVDTATPANSHVTNTLLTCDEPRDVVFAGPGRTRAFVTTARRGQNCPVPANLITPGQDRAVVQVYDATNLGTALGGTPIANLTLFTDTPRALAVTPDGTRVYAAGFESGNQTTTIPEGQVTPNGGVPPFPPGSTPGAPATGLIVRFDGTRWVDELNRDWSAKVAFSLPDRDVFVIDATANPPALVPTGSSISGVGTTLFNMAVRPNASGQIYVGNLEARNFVRFEQRINTNLGVQGEIVHSRITVINGTTPTPIDLNPHIDYSCVPPSCISPQSERDRSIAFPLDMVFSSDGARLYVAGFGSGVVGIFDAAALEAGTLNATTKVLVPVGQGPSGVVLDEARNRLYVMNRISHDISIVANASTPASAFEQAVVPLRFDPTPPFARDGRIFLYDAKNTSGHGDQACASCHIFGDFDSLAWDLGDPFGPVLPNLNPFRVANGNNVSLGGNGSGIACSDCTFHPLKGPMTTQTLRGMAAAGPMHWRGDRTGSTTGNDPLDPQFGFKAFNGAFVTLVGRSAPLSDAEMQAYTDFILNVALPPNPIRALDNSQTSDQSAGQNLFLTQITDRGVLPCQFCHRMPLGTDGLSSIEGETQEFKIAHLRNLYQKIGMFGVSGGPSVGAQVRGFGFLHDGSIPTVQNFISNPIFQNLSTSQERQIEQFLLAFDTGMKPTVGQQVSVDAATFNAVSQVNRITLLVARDDAGDCELTAKGTVGGLARGWVYVGGNAFQPDRNAEPTISVTDLRTLAATPGQEITFTCTALGTGVRIGVDRDEDGVYDRRELDCGSDPANPFSTSTTSGPCGGTTTTTLATTTTTIVTTTTTTTTSSTTTTTIPLLGIPSQSLVMKDKVFPSNPAARRFTFTAKTSAADPAHRIVVPARGSAGDPTVDGAVGGAVLTVYNANGSGEKVQVALPPGRWTALGSGATPSGYKWSGLSTDPVQQVLVRGDLIKVKAGRSSWLYTLDEQSQGRIAVRLVLGGIPGWCASVPAKLSGNPPSSANNDHIERFIGQPKTPPPAVCPAVP